MHQHFLFLDFDGVLHLEADTYIDPFNQLVSFCAALRRGDPNQQIGIVISSAWRNMETLHELRSHFPPDIQRRILGVTPNFKKHHPALTGVRQREIEHWMQAHAPQGRWLAIDDRANYFDNACPHLFWMPDWAALVEMDLSEPSSVLQALEQQVLSTSQRDAQATQNYIELMQQFEARLVAFLALGGHGA